MGSCSDTDIYPKNPNKDSIYLHLRKIHYLTSMAKLAFSRIMSSAMSSPSSNKRLILGLDVSTLTTNSGRIYRSSYRDVPFSFPHRAYGFRQGVLFDCIHHSGSR